MRPALVIQTDAANSNPRYPNTIVLTISTRGLPVATHVRLVPDRHNGLREPSWVKCEQILTISKDRLVSLWASCRRTTCGKWKPPSRRLWRFSDGHMDFGTERAGRGAPKARSFGLESVGTTIELKPPADRFRQHHKQFTAVADWPQSHSRVGFAGGAFAGAAGGGGGAAGFGSRFPMGRDWTSTWTMAEGTAAEWLHLSSNAI